MAVSNSPVSVNRVVSTFSDTMTTLWPSSVAEEDFRPSSAAIEHFLTSTSSDSKEFLAVNSLSTTMSVNSYQHTVYSPVFHQPTTVLSGTIMATIDNSNNNNSVLFEYVEPTSRSSVTEGTDSTQSFMSSAFLEPSSSRLGGVTENHFTGTFSLVNETAVFPELTDGSGNVTTQAGVINTSAIGVVDENFVSTTPFSGSGGLWSETLLSSSSAADNGTVVPIPGGDTDGEALFSHYLILWICVGATLFITLIVLIAVCVCYCRRKKVKETKPVQDDLWVRQDSPRIPVLPMAVLPQSGNKSSLTSAPENASISVETAKSNESAHCERCVATYDFPSQQDSQLALTPGDVISVLEKADNGWWRGINQGDNRSGWFPSSFVAPVNHVVDVGSGVMKPEAESNAATEAVQEQHSPRPRISSFLIRKKPSVRPLQLSNSVGLGTAPVQGVLNSQVSRSQVPLHPVSPVKLTSTSTLGEDFSTSCKDQVFKALFSYKAAYRGEISLREGDIIVGKERDRNGWMLGSKAQGGEEGWFPAVYVDKINDDITSPTTARNGHGTASSQMDHEVYDLLTANRTKSPDQSWVAIEHRAVKSFRAQNHAQMSLHVGDVVAVVEALDTGWWLGCHGDRLGWFPGDRVKLVEEKSEDTLDTVHLFPRRPDLDRTVNDDNVSIASTGSRECQEKQIASLNHSQESVLSDGGRPKPARRAPKAPVSACLQLEENAGGLSRTSTLSMNLRPARPAPAPPPHSSNSRTASVGSMDKLEAATATEHRRPRKPKVVRIPKEKLGLDKLSSWPSPEGTSSSPIPSPTFQAIAVSQVNHVPSNSQRREEGTNGSLTPQTSSHKAAANNEHHHGDHASGVSESFPAAYHTHTPSTKVSSEEPIQNQSQSEQIQTNVPNLADQVQRRDTFHPTDVSPSETEITLSSFKSPTDCTESHDNKEISELNCRTTKTVPNIISNVQSTTVPTSRASLSAAPNQAKNSKSDDTPDKHISPQEDERQLQTYSGNSNATHTAFIHNDTEDTGDILPGEQNVYPDNTNHSASESETPQQHSAPKDNDILSATSAISSTPSPLPDLVETTREPVVKQTVIADTVSLSIPAVPLIEETLSQPHTEKTADEPLTNEKPDRSSPNRISTQPVSKNPVKLPPVSKIPKPISKGLLETKSHIPTKPIRPRSGIDANETADTKLEKEALPALRPTPAKNEDDATEDGVEIPPEGVSGRVSIIVQHINRMASVDGDRIPGRKTSAQFLPDDLLEQIRDEEEDSGERQKKPSSPKQIGLPGDHRDIFRNGESHTGPQESSVSPNRSNRNIDSPASRNANKPENMLAVDDSTGNQHKSAQVHHGSDESHPRRQSTKRSRMAPPPPTSPPPPLRRKSKKIPVPREHPKEY